MSSFLLLAGRQIIRVDMEPTQETIENVLAGSAVRLSVHEPGGVTVYVTAESMAQRTEPNALGTLFCHKHGAIALDTAVFGRVAITCDPEHATPVGVPRWVVQDLYDMLPAATELADGGVRIYS